MVKPTNRISIRSSCRTVGRYQTSRKKGVKNDPERAFCLRRVESPDQGKYEHVLCWCQADHSRGDLVAFKEAAT